MKKVLCVFSLFLIVLLSGCTYSQQKARAVILPSFLYVDDSHFYIIVYKKIYQSPTGISTFPNGGIQKINNQILYFFMCDVNKKSCIETGRFSRNQLIKQGLLKPGYKLHLMGSSPVEIYMSDGKTPLNIYTVYMADIKKSTLKFIIKNNLKKRSVSLYGYDSLPKNIKRNTKVNYKLSIYSDLIKIAPKNASYKSYKTIFELDHKDSKIDLKYVLN